VYLPQQKNAPSSDGQADIEVTDEILEAGAAILCDRYDQHAYLGREIAREVFLAMLCAAPR
jgi:hypothetical protein